MSTHPPKQKNAFVTTAAAAAAGALADHYVHTSQYCVGDGVIVDTTTFNAAREAARAKKCTLRISGTLLIDAALTISSVESWEFEGAPGDSNGNKPQSYLIKKSTVAGPLVTIIAQNTNIRGGGIIGQAGNTGDGFAVTARSVTLDHVYVQGCGNDGVRVGSDSAGANANLVTLIRVCCTSNGRHGIFLDDADTNANCVNLISPCTMSNGGDGIKVNRSRFNKIDNLLSEYNTGIGLNLSTTSNTTVTGGDSEGNTGGEFSQVSGIANDIVGLTLLGERYNSRNTVRFKITPTATLYLPDLYFDLSLAPSEFWRAVTASGGDVRVYKQDGITQVAREISGFDKTNKKGGLWIKVTSGTAFYVCAGTYEAEPAADATYGKYAVWETACKLRMHLANVNDSTVNQLNAGATTAGLVDAKLGKGYLFTQGASPTDAQMVTIPATTTLDFATTMTFGGWYKHRKSYEGALCGKITGSPYNGYLLFHPDNSDSIRIFVNGAARRDSAPLVNGTWYRVIVTWTGTNYQLYVNGAADGAAVALADAPASAGAKFTIGGYIGTVGGCTADEVIAYDRAWSADEVAQDYAMTNSPSTFWTVGTPEWWMPLT